MGGERGQASILIAIIFQILFVFFAMVINVGLLVHDKINLQNSTDIAAYYAAMKQAEVLNAMAQLNYQIHQTWKLFNWRIWVLADAGRNIDYLGGMGTTPQTDAETMWLNGSTPVSSYPVVCVDNPIWTQLPGHGQNLCKNINLNLSSLVPPTLIGTQGLFAGVFNTFISGISQQNSYFQGNFSQTGLANYRMAALFLASFKISAARRRFAIHHLQNLLIANPNDFTDLSGAPVKATAQLTLTNNLTASNKANGGPTFEFQNSLGGNPFMVPIEVRAFVNYLDFDTGNSITANVRQINVPSHQDVPTSNPPLWTAAQPVWHSDYAGPPTVETASNFASGESEDFTNQNSLNSLIGFEKNPWTMAYVRVAATTHPKMLFSPITGGSSSGITLSAESYAMPFGGKMGPWYYDSWPSGQGNSVPGNLIQNLNFSAPRMDVTAVNTSLPNYSRYPGDTIGLSSRMARYVGLSQINGKVPNHSDYDELLNTSPTIDAIVAKTPNAAVGPSLRIIEKAAVAPDLFDATYYSVTYDFPTRYPQAYGMVPPSTGPTALQNLSCFDLGNELPQAIATGPDTISNVFFGGTGGPNPTLWATSTAPPFWILTQPQHLNTSWSQGDPGQYDDKQAALSVGQTWNNPGNSDTAPAGGRAGYSVKLVSKHFLQRSDLPLGGVGVTGKIANPPQ